jgi:hypothetical protein
MYTLTEIHLCRKFSTSNMVRLTINAAAPISTVSEVFVDGYEQGKLILK